MAALATAMRPGLFILALGLAASPAPCAAAEAPPAPPPLEHFFGNDAFGAAVLSPSGRYLAVRTAPKGRRDMLAVIDLETKAGKPVAEYADADIGHIQWVNDYRLVYDLRDGRTAHGDQIDAPGLYAVNRDGSARMTLADRDGVRRAYQPWNTFLMDQPGKQTSAWIYVTRPLYDYRDDYFGTCLRHLNTETGASEIAPEPDLEVNDFMLDFQGQPRLAIRTSGFGTGLHYRDPASGKWRDLTDVSQDAASRESIKPLGFGPDGALYVIANGGADLATLRTLDLTTGKVSKNVLVSTAGYDFDGTLVVDKDKVLGVRLRTDAESNVWFDPAMQALQAAVDKVFPATINLITVPSEHSAPWVLVESYSDRQPARFSLYHTLTGMTELVGSTYPSIQATQMGRQEALHVKARDGLDIPGLLTLPATGGRKNLPMVVLVHGDPWARGASWR